MKPVAIIVLIAGLSVLFACKKSRPEKSEYPFVYLDQCISRQYGSNKVRLCFDELVSDSRCPINALCITAGTAIAKFTFKTSDQTHFLTLATDTLNTTYPKDTTVSGYKIEFINWNPIPRQEKILRLLIKSGLK
jgi:hypothetical protein